MLIQKLILHNLASIADATIDFRCDALRDEPVFLITGPTGAGKTTILDGICLALFGKTPRMEKMEGRSERYAVGEDSQLSVSDNRQLMRRTTGECFAELYFEADGKLYKALWYVKRARKKPTGNLQPVEHTLENLTTGELIKKGTEREIEAVIGLRYEQFCRTAILAQGEFTRFLQSSTGDKSDILEKLTGTGIYSRIGQLIYEETQAKRTALDQLRAQQESVRTLTDEERTQLAADIAAQTQSSNALTTSITEMTARRDWLQRQQTLERDLEKKRQLLQTERIHIESPSFREEERLIADYSRSADARHWITELRTLDTDTQKCERSLNSFEEEQQQILASLSQIPHSDEEHQQLLDRIRHVTRQKGDIARALSACQLLNERQRAAASSATALREQQERLRPVSERLPVETQQCEDARLEAERWQTAYDKAALSMNDWVREARHRLSVGDTCPVCGQPVAEHLSDEHFSSVLAPIEENKRASALRFQEVSQRLAALRQEAKEINVLVERLTAQHEREQQAVAIQLAAVKEACVTCGISTYDDSTLDHLQAMSQEAEATSARLFLLQEKSARLTTLRQQISDLTSHLSTIRQRTAERRQALAAFTVESGIDELRLNALLAYSPSAVEKVKQKHEQLLRSVNILQGEEQLLAAQLQQHLAARPSMSESDTSESLSQQLIALQRQQQDIQQVLGALRQQLRSDDERKQQLGDLLRRCEESENDYARWNRLCSLFGDREGKRFRNIAQSFILGHLLNIANRYLRQFSDRYTLTYNPGSLVILVSDSYSAAPPQAASILSGGESFMVSLSLALALAQLCGNQANVDTLFIDEGFGTLDSDCLGSVMDTLERLHQLGGRRVGIISHVEELQERINAKIIVSRDGSTTIYPKAS